MNTLLQWLGSEGWVHVVKALLHTLWIGAVAVAGLALVLRRTANPTLRYRTSLAALFSVVLGGMVMWAASQQKANPATASSTAVTPASVTTSTAATLSAGTTQETASWAPPPIQPQQSHWVPMVALMWMAGASAMLFRAAWLVGEAERIKRATRPLEDVRILECLATARQKLNLARRFRVAVSEQLASPAVIGFIVPTLIFPLSLLTTLRTEEIELILLHELAHIRRADYFVNLCQLVAEAILFFNPAVWWISRQIRQEREACCDAIAISVAGGKVEYARTLVAVAEQMCSPMPAAAAAFGDAHNESGLKDRIRRLLDPGYRPAIRLTWGALFGSLVFGTILLLASAAGTLWTVTAAAKLLTPQQRIDRIESTMRKMGQLPSAEPDEKATIEVSAKIKTADGSPLPDDRYAGFETQSDHNSTGTSAAVDKTGDCKATVPKGDLYFYARVNGFAPAALGPIDTRSSNRVDNLELVLQRGFPVSVRVIDGNSGQPLSGVKVKGQFWISTFAPFEAFDVTTDSAGTAVLSHCAPMRLEIAAYKEGYESVQKRVDTAQPNSVIEIRTQRAKPVSGNVISRITGKPIPNASLYVIGAEGPSAEQRRDPRALSDPIAVTDVEGDFVIDRFSRGTRHWLLIDAPGYAQAVLPDVQVGMTNLQAALGPQIIVRGKFIGDLKRVRSEQGHPVCWVAAAYPIGAHSTSYTGKNVEIRPVADGGAFEFTNRLGGQAAITLEGHGRFEREITASIDDWIIDLNKKSEPVQMRPLVLKFVHPSGVPPKGTISMTLPSPDAKSYRGADFEITNGVVRCDVAVGKMFSYEPKQTIGYTFKSSTMEPMPPGNGPLEISVPLIPAGAVFAQARDVDGSLVRECFFSVYQVKSLFTAEDDALHLPNSDGYSPGDSRPRKFVASPLPLDRTYLIIAQRENNFCLSKAVKLSEEVPDQTVEVQFRPGVTLSGTVLSPNGSPLAGVEVKLDFHYKDSGFGLRSVTTGDKGEFVFENCTPNLGEYTVEVHSAGMRSLRVPIEPGKSPLRLQFELGLKLSGQFVDSASGRPIINAGVRAMPDGKPLPAETTRTDDSGRFEFTTLHDEKYRFFADGTYFTHGSPLVRPGEKGPLVLKVMVNSPTVKLGQK